MESSPPSEALERIVRETRHFVRAPEHFLRAWQRAIHIAGPKWFGDGTREGLQIAKTKWDLCPRVEQIREAFGVLSGGERLFLAALVSFYDSRDGGELLKRCGFSGLADLSGLDLERRQVIARLLLYYNGW